MQNVKVNKQELLDKIKANREKHITDHKELVKNFWVTVAGKVEQLKAKVETQSGNHFSLNENLPASHVADYDQVIQMIEMSVEDTITLEYNEFSNYVMDKWHWKSQFDTANALYASSARLFNK